MTIDEKVDSILTNHLPHLTERMANVEGGLSVILKVVVVALLGIVSNLIIAVIR